MKSRKVLMTVLSTCIITAGVVVSPFSSAAIVHAENTQTLAASAVATNTADTATPDATTSAETGTTETASEGSQAQESQEVQLTPEQQAAKDRKDAMEALRNDPNHVHTFRWIAQMNESESAEGTMNYMCPECGKIWYNRPIPAYTAFSGDVAHRIETAPQDGTVRVITSLFYSFNSDVMTALSERPDVSLYVSFLDQEYKGNRVSFLIPPGQDYLSMIDENGYTGFLYLGGKYGLTIEVPEEKPAETAQDTSQENTNE